MKKREGPTRDENHVAIPSLLAVSAVHHHLIETKKSTSVSIILESGEPREVHHFATLLGYGACAINPYLARRWQKVWRPETLERNRGLH